MHTFYACDFGGTSDESIWFSNGISSVNELKIKVYWNQSRGLNMLRCRHTAPMHRIQISLVMVLLMLKLIIDTHSILS